MMNNIKWEDGAICHVGGKQWKHELDDNICIENLVSRGDFQLNEIRQGDYIEASELNTEQKYNDVVEVFEVLGIHKGKRHSYYAFKQCELIKVTEFGVQLDASLTAYCKRKITYPQLMAIGKLKRAMIERDNELNYSKRVSDLGCYVIGDSDWSDEHYNHFYQLTEEDIKAGEVKVDAYFVNRMWRINSWEDTGAGFHILKTLPRIANNKNSLRRELVALKKQVDILCKLHGVDDEGMK